MQITKVFVVLSSIEFYSVFVVILFAGRSAGMACIVLCNLGRVTVCLRLNAFKGKWFEHHFTPLTPLLLDWRVQIWIPNCYKMNLNRLRVATAFPVLPFWTCLSSFMWSQHDTNCISLQQNYIQTSEKVVMWTQAKLKPHSLNLLQYFNTISLPIVLRIPIMTLDELNLLDIN